jgi:undecaprenyl-diphosphatase
VIRAYVPWYLVRNYLAFAFVACLAVLQLARARGQRVRFALAAVILAASFIVFYALAPELLTPGPAGGEMTFLFGGAALAAVILTRGLESPRWRKPAASGQRPAVKPFVSLKSRAWYLIFPLASLIVFLWDVPLFHALNGLALRTPLMDVPVQFLMNDYIAPTALVLALLGLWFAGRDDAERTEFQRTVLRALLAMALASVTLKLINEVYLRPRPFAFDDAVRLLFYHPSDSTMPSNAATVCCALSIAVWLWHKRLGVVMLVLASGMTLARVIGGVHYPADVIAGAWLGGVWAWLVHRATWLDRLLDPVLRLALLLRLA